MPLTCLTNYCFPELGDERYTAGKAPVRPCKILGYDGDKRLLIEVGGIIASAHRAYVNPSRRKLARLQATKREEVLHLVRRHKLQGAYRRWLESTYP